MAISELVGVYDADGGLCDITHSPVRRKASWDRMAASLPVPVRLLHLNELDDDLGAVVAAAGAPLVLAREEAGCRVLVTGSELDEMAGSVDALEAELRRHLVRSCGGIA